MIVNTDSGTHTQLLQKVQTLSDAPEGKTVHEKLGVKTFEQNEDVYIFLNLPKHHILFHLVIPFRRYFYVFQKKK